MTVRELIDELKCFDDDMEVVMQPGNSRYVDGISGVTDKKLHSFWGKDRKVLVLMSSGQDGAV